MVVDLIIKLCMHTTWSIYRALMCCVLVHPPDGGLTGRVDHVPPQRTAPHRTQCDRFISARRRRAQFRSTIAWCRRRRRNEPRPTRVRRWPRFPSGRHDADCMSTRQRSSTRHGGRQALWLE